MSSAKVTWPRRHGKRSAICKRPCAGAGAGLSDVVKVTVYLADFADYPAMDAAYREFFGQFPPARATIRADLVYPSLRVELEAWAIVAEEVP